MMRADTARAPDLARILPEDARETLHDFARETGYGVRVWVRAGAGWTVLEPADGGGDDGPGPGTAQVDGDGEAPIAVEVLGAPADEARSLARFLAATLRRVVRHDVEIRSVSHEIADRYEEITLLYSISEILGATISLEQAAGTILGEVLSTVGAHRATLWVHDPQRNQLDRAAVVGYPGQIGPISVDDPCSVTAEVFREARPVLLAPGEEHERHECDPALLTRDAFLSVPVSYTPPEGETRTVGVINVAGRDSDEPFSAGDLKLLSAIASQIGAAVENNRLIAASLLQERMVRELELAHDLQLKLLPPLEPFAGYAQVAARCVPAESVGGDFYHLFRLPGGRLGVMIGDVSSHGFGAALIMALTMSAVAIHAAEGDPPAQVLKRVHHALIDELTSTEMYLTLFYGVVDPAAATLVYANAGHPYAFRIGAAGEPQRLAATNPPLGMVDLDDYREERVSWSAKRDLLFLFTDGLSDALDTDAGSGEATLLREAVGGRDHPPTDVVERLFALARTEGRIPADDRTAVLVRV